MGSYVNVFLKTELTVIPGLLDKFFGKYYNNTLCNGATWMFLTWYILHVIFTDLLNALLKRMKYKEYIRVRLLRSLWYLGFYSTSFVYCTATLIRNNIPIFTLKSQFDSTNLPSGNLILGFIVVSTFYLHSAFWERLKNCQEPLAASYFCLFFFLFFSYFLRFVEGSFRLTIVVSVTQIALECARCVAITVKRDKCSGDVIGTSFFIAGLSVFAVNYLVVIPLVFGYSLIRGFIPSISILLTLLIIWLIIEIYSSTLVKAIFHWLHHDDGPDRIRGRVHCEIGIIECSLFPMRNDATYHFLKFRKEMMEREERSMSQRKPKNRNMVFQTLKCMMAIKRKIHEKRSNMHKETNANTDTGGGTKEDNSIESNSEEINSDEIVGGKLQFHINNKNEVENKYKKE